MGCTGWGPLSTEDPERSDCYFFSIVSIISTPSSQTPLVHAGLFWHFCNPQNSNMDYRIFNVRRQSFCMRVCGRPQFIISSEGLLSENDIWRLSHQTQYTVLQVAFSQKSQLRYSCHPQSLNSRNFPSFLTQSSGGWITFRREDLYLSLPDLTTVARWVPQSNLTPELKELFRQLVNWLVLVHKMCRFLVQPSYLNSVLFSHFSFFLFFLFQNTGNHLSFRFVVLCCRVSGKECGLLSSQSFVHLFFCVAISWAACAVIKCLCSVGTVCCSTALSTLSCHLIYEQILCTVLCLAHVTPKQSFCQFDSYGACTVKAV